MSPHPHYVSEQTYVDSIWNIPYSVDPDVLIESGIDAHLWSLRLLQGKCPDFFEFPRSMLPEAHSVDALVNVDGFIFRVTI